MAAGQSPLSCWTQAAGAQERLWPGRSALAARHYNLGQESQANGPILLIQPRGRHTAALSFTARREDKSERGGEGSSWGAFGLDRPQRALFFTPERESSWTSSSICGRVWLGAITQSISPGSPLWKSQSGRRCVQAPLRAPNAAAAFVCFPLRMSVKGPLIFIHIPRVLLISSTFFHLDRQDIL